LLFEFFKPNTIIGLKVVDVMKKWIINKCMNYIKTNTDYDQIKLKEIEYGLTGLYLTFSKLIIIAIISIILGIFKEVVIYMFVFNILRSTGFGLHATKSWICLLSSTLIFVGIPIICTHIYINVYIKCLIGMIGIILMYKNAPADTKKKPIVSKKRRTIYKIISTMLAIIFSISMILINNNFLSNCLLFSLILENFLISPSIYKIFKLPYNNYIEFLREHPNFNN